MRCAAESTSARPRFPRAARQGAPRPLGRRNLRRTQPRSGRRQGVPSTDTSRGEGEGNGTGFTFILEFLGKTAERRRNRIKQCTLANIRTTQPSTLSFQQVLRFLRLYFWLHYLVFFCLCIRENPHSLQCRFQRNRRQTELPLLGIPILRYKCAKPSLVLLSLLNVNKVLCTSKSH